MGTITKVYTTNNGNYLSKADDGSPWVWGFSVTLETGVFPDNSTDIKANFVALAAEFYGVEGQYDGNHADRRMRVESARWDEGSSTIHGLFWAATDQHIPPYKLLEIMIYSRVEVKLNQKAKVNNVKDRRFNRYPKRIKHPKRRAKSR